MNDPPRVAYDDLDVDEEQRMTWGGRPFTGIAIERFPDGAPRSETAFVDGVKEGVSRIWHSNGRLADEDRFWRGSRHGKGSGWTREGKLVREELCELGILVRATFFTEDGSILRTWDVDPNDTLLLARRRAWGEVAPPV